MIGRLSLRRITVLVLILSGFSSFAQVRLTVRAAGRREVLSYASVFNQSRNKLSFSDQNGFVAGSFGSGDSLTISYVGYETLQAVVNREEEQTFLLQESKGLMDGVTISRCKKHRSFDWSNLEGDGSGRKFGGVSWNVEAMNGKMAVLVQPAESGARLEAFSFWLETNFGGPKSALQAPMIFSFYSVNDSTLLPGELISSRRIVYQPKKAGKQTILLDSVRIIIPPSGLYLCLEYVFDERYQWPMRHLDRDKGIDTAYLQYGGRIDGEFSNHFPLAFFNYRKDQWFFPGNRTREHLFQVQGTIRLSLKLEVCQD